MEAVAGNAEMRSRQSSPSPGRWPTAKVNVAGRCVCSSARRGASPQCKCALRFLGRFLFPAGQARVTAETGDVAKESQHEANASRNLYTARTGHAQQR